MRPGTASTVPLRSADSVALAPEVSPDGQSLVCQPRNAGHLNIGCHKAVQWVGYSHYVSWRGRRQAGFVRQGRHSCLPLVSTGLESCAYLEGQQAGGVFGEVSQDQVGPGAASLAVRIGEEWMSRNRGSPKNRAEIDSQEGANPTLPSRVQDHNSRKPPPGVDGRPFPT